MCSKSLRAIEKMLEDDDGDLSATKLLAVIRSVFPRVKVRYSEEEMGVVFGVFGYKKHPPTVICVSFDRGYILCELWGDGVNNHLSPDSEELIEEREIFFKPVLGMRKFRARLKKLRRIMKENARILLERL